MDEFRAACIDSSCMWIFITTVYGPVVLPTVPLSDELKDEIEEIAFKSVCVIYLFVQKTLFWDQDVDLRDYAAQVDGDLSDLENSLIEKCLFRFIFIPFIPLSLVPR